MNGIWCFYKRDLTEIACPFHHVKTQRESAIYELGRGSWAEHNQAGTLILDFPVSK